MHISMQNSMAAFLRRPISMYSLVAFFAILHDLPSAYNDYEPLRCVTGRRDTAAH
jgi:hypothetical protein